MDSPISSSLVQLWRDALEECIMDADLLELAVLVRSAKRLDAKRWFQDTIRADESSAISFESARARALRGFMEEDATAAWIEELVENETFWEKEVLGTAQLRTRLEARARYWFHTFATETDLDKSWAAFRLFLTCADRRCWIWIGDELSNVTGPKRRFFGINLRTIQEACKENERKWRESFLDCKVNVGLSPWMQ
jgi:hypothetical protein